MGALMGSADPTHAVGRDNAGATRPLLDSAGAFAPGTYGRYMGGQVSGRFGEPRLLSSAYPTLGSTIQVSVEDARPGAMAMFKGTDAFLGIQDSVLVDTSPAAWYSMQVGVVDPQGQLSFPVTVSNNTIWAGKTFQASWSIRDTSAVLGVARSRCVQWVME